jgi:hypothetical protein
MIRLDVFGDGGAFVKVTPIHPLAAFNIPTS